MQFIRIKNLITVLVILVVTGWGSNAFALNMSLSDTCGYATQCIRVQIWNPPGGSVSVNPDKSINLPESVVEGTKLVALVKMTEECGFVQGDTLDGGTGRDTLRGDTGSDTVTADDILNPAKNSAKSLRFFSRWTPAKDNGVLPVRCAIPLESLVDSLNHP